MSLTPGQCSVTSSIHFHVSESRLHSYLCPRVVQRYWRVDLASATYAVAGLTEKQIMMMCVSAYDNDLSNQSRQHALIHLNLSNSSCPAKSAPVVIAGSPAVSHRLSSTA